MQVLADRRGVASIVGTVFFVMVFMLAVGALAYLSGLQTGSIQAEQAGAKLTAARAAENLAFSIGTGGLEAVNRGPDSTLVNHLVMIYQNGTVYTIPVDLTVVRGGEVAVEGMVNGGDCSPGKASCASKYAQIVSGGAPGSSLGLVTSLGNVFWYSHGDGQVDWGSITGFPAGCPAGESVDKLGTTPGCSGGGSVTKVVTTRALTVGVDNFTSTGLVVRLSNDTLYAFYAFTSVSPAFGVEQYEFEIHALPLGASLLIACAPMAYPLGGGNQATKCVDSAGTPINYPLEFGVAPPVFETPGIFGAVMTGSAPGNLEIDIGCVANCGAVVVNPGSFIVVQASG